jgi:hypothetical protein
MGTTLFNRSDDVAKTVQRKAHWVVRAGEKALTTVAAEARGVIETQITKQKNNVATEILLFANALRAANGSLIQSPALKSVGFGDSLISKIDDLGTSIRDRDIDEIVHDTSQFARSQPAVYICGAIAAGFVAARFFKSHSSAA